MTSELYGDFTNGEYYYTWISFQNPKQPGMYESMMCSPVFYKEIYSFYGDTEFGDEVEHLSSTKSEYRASDRLDWEGGMNLWERIPFVYRKDAQGCSSRRNV